MSLADEIFLFRNGRIVQQGPPQEVYRKPADRYVAEFLGKANLLPVRVRPTDDGCEVATADGQHILASPADPDWAGRAGEWTGVVRPEAWSLAASGDGRGLSGRVASIMFLGDRMELVVATPLGDQLVLVGGYEAARVGDLVDLVLDPARLHLVARDQATIAL